MISYVTANLHILLVYSLQLKQTILAKKDEKNILFILFIFLLCSLFSKTNT